MLLLVQLSNSLQEVAAVSSPVEQCRSFVNTNIRVSKEPGCLHAAIVAGKVTLIRHLLDEGVDPNEIYGDQTPLNLCICFYNPPETDRQVKLLIKHGANVNLENPLHTACQRGLTTVIDMLIENGASTESVDRDTGFTPLQFTIDLLGRSTTKTHRHMLIQVVHKLLQYTQVDVTNTGLHGLDSSPLQLAILTSQPSIILDIIFKGRPSFTFYDIQMALQLVNTSFNGPVDVRDDIIATLSSINTKSVPSLQELSRTIVRQALSRKLSGVRDLPCSGHVKRFVINDRTKTDGFRDKAYQYLKLF